MTPGKAQAQGKYYRKLGTSLPVLVWPWSQVLQQKNCGEKKKRNAMRCLCTLTLSILSPRFPHLSFLPGECSTALSLTASAPFRAKSHPKTAQGQAHGEDNRWTFSGSRASHHDGKDSRGTERIWKRKRGHAHRPDEFLQAMQGTSPDAVSSTLPATPLGTKVLFLIEEETEDGG